MQVSCMRAADWLAAWAGTAAEPCCKYVNWATQLAAASFAAQRAGQTQSTTAERLS